MVFRGDAWPAFDEDRLVAVTPADEPLTELELVDLTTGQGYGVAVGNATAEPMTEEQLRNAELPFTCPSGTPVKLVDGTFEESGQLSDRSHHGLVC